MDIEALAAGITRSRKYRRLCPDTIRRVAQWAAARASSPRDAAKRARRKLHQVYAAYLESFDLAKADALLDELAAAARDEPLRRGLCRRILALHASTRERLPVLEGFYEEVFDRIGRPRRLLDVGCGLNPFALPWMPLPPDAELHAWEIDQGVVDLINRFLRILGAPGAAIGRDILTAPPAERYDAAFLLKMLPCLQRQDPEAPRAVLANLPARWIVVSYPVQSLGGRDKDMRSTYADQFADLVAGTGWTAEELAIREELTYIVRKDS